MAKALASVMVGYRDPPPRVPLSVFDTGPSRWHHDTWFGDRWHRYPTQDVGLHAYGDGKWYVKDPTGIVCIGMAGNAEEAMQTVDRLYGQMSG